MRQETARQLVHYHWSHPLLSPKQVGNQSLPNYLMVQVVREGVVTKNFYPPPPQLPNCVGSGGQRRAGARAAVPQYPPNCLLVQVAREGQEPEQLYPNTFFLPESGIQRGNVCQGDGDPLSPSWSSIPGNSSYVMLLSENKVEK
jgi:hypothetical protein